MNKKILRHAFWCSAFILCMMNSAVAKPAEPALQITKPLYAWKTENSADASGPRCSTQNMYDNGTSFALDGSTGSGKRIALHFPQDKMQTGQHFDLTAQIDKGDVFPVDAMATSPRILTLNIPEALPEQMRKGQALYLRGPNDEVIYQMTGMNQAVMALRDCMATAPQASPPPAAVQIAATIQPVAPRPALAIAAPLPEIQTAAPGLLPAPWQEAFAGTAFAPQKLLPVKKPTTNQPLDYAWQNGSLLIGVKSVALDGETEKTSVNYMRVMKKHCTGSFLAESSALVTGKTPDSAWQVAEVGCTNNKKRDSIAALLFTFSPAEMRVYFFEAQAVAGRDAIKARDAILAKISK